MELVIVIGLILLIYRVGYLSAENKPSSKSGRSKPFSQRAYFDDVENRRYENDKLHSNAEIDNDLLNFRIAVSYGNEERSNNKVPGRWIKSGETITIKGCAIVGGFFYFGGQLPSTREYYGIEASLVDDQLKIVDKPAIYEDHSLGYWPRYCSISAECRGAYIKWLAGNRSDPNIPLGYVFIYFYGLERRVIVDSIVGSVDDLEFVAIFKEILRLKEIYGKSNSFNNYSARLLETMCILRPDIVSHSELEKNSTRSGILLKYKLAQTVNDGLPISADLALEWLKFYPEHRLKMPARRCPNEFSKLFSRLYTKKYEDGLVVKPNKTQLYIEYRSASPSLKEVRISEEDLPDPSNLMGSTKKLIAIADKCTDALDAYSRYISKKNVSRTDISAIVLLPEELEDVSDALGLSDFKKWAESCITESNGIVDVSEFWAFTKKPIPGKINKKESDLIQVLAEKSGFGIAPDARYHYAKPHIDGKLVLFRGGHKNYSEPSDAFNETGIVIRLGAMLAIVDSHIDKSEIAYLERIIDNNTNLSPTEKSSLHSYLVWRLNSPVNMSGLKARIEKLDVEYKTMIGKILIGLVLSDGRIHPEEIKQLERTYTALGLDKSRIVGDIHSLSTRKDDMQRTRHAITNLDKETEGDFTLDENLLTMYELQTQDVKTMLDAIFVDEDISDDNSIKEDTYGDPGDKGIDTQHYALFESIIVKDSWSNDEISDLCKESGLMVSGAIETINDWSFEQVKAPVILEEGDEIFVDQDIVEELEV